MRLTAETVSKVNEEYRLTRISRELRLNVGTDGCWSDSVYSRNWQVCRLEELSDMIDELTALRETIETVTGVRC